MANQYDRKNSYPALKTRDQLFSDCIRSEGGVNNCSETEIGQAPPNMFPSSPEMCISSRTGTDQKKPPGEQETYAEVREIIFLYLSQNSQPAPEKDAVQAIFVQLHQQQEDE